MILNKFVFTQSFQSSKISEICMKNPFWASVVCDCCHTAAQCTASLAQLTTWTWLRWFHQSIVSNCRKNANIVDHSFSKYTHIIDHFCRCKQHREKVFTVMCTEVDTNLVCISEMAIWRKGWAPFKPTYGCLCSPENGHFRAENRVCAKLYAHHCTRNKF